MALNWRGNVTHAELAHASPHRRVLRIRVVYRIYDEADPDTIIKASDIYIPYALHYFAGLTLPQAWELILETGAGETPSLMSIGASMVDDWDEGEVVRNLPLPHEFGP